ncbi:hypothetical protein BDV97DRAFT_364146 [Delphinella strobiligena]|nr:hypothetical protein BDV97DRAFT_364146 [Delphinella strobiligena]
MFSAIEAFTTQVYFLKKLSLYETEKPYSLRFTPPEGFPRANVALESHNIPVHDIRSSKDELSLEKNGLAIMDLDTRMKYEDFDNEQAIREVYLREVSEALQGYLGASHVQIFEHTVRKRHETFPISTGEPYKYNQPTSMAHVDTTLPWAVAMARKLNPEKADQMLKGRFQCINIWKPITGPVRDWPLAMCDPRTVNPAEDFEPCDLVYPDYVVENRQLYFNRRQKWLYLSEQQKTEAWLFVQSDTAGDTMSVPHTSFPNPLASLSDAPRESVEARALVFYA